MNIKFIHESAHQENAAAGSPKQILFSEGIGNVGKGEIPALVEDVDDYLFLSELESEKDLAAALLPVPVSIGIDDAFADGHADFVTVLIVESGFAGDP